MVLGDAGKPSLVVPLSGEFAAHQVISRDPVPALRIISVQDMEHFDEVSPPPSRSKTGFFNHLQYAWVENPRTLLAFSPDTLIVTPVAAIS